MSSSVLIEKVEYFRDARGWLIEPVNGELLSAQRNIHVVLTEPGAIRGNHFHERSTEVFVLMGPGLVRIRENSAPRDISVPAGEAFRFTIPPRVAHAIYNPGPGTMLLISFNTRPFDRAHPDVVPDVLIGKPPGVAA